MGRSNPWNRHQTIISKGFSGNLLIPGTLLCYPGSTGSWFSFLDSPFITAPPASCCTFTGSPWGSVLWRITTYLLVHLVNRLKPSLLPGNKEKMTLPFKSTTLSYHTHISIRRPTSPFMSDMHTSTSKLDSFFFLWSSLSTISRVKENH